MIKADDSALSLKEQRAERIMLLRGLTRLSRRAFARKHSITTSSLQRWELGRGGGLTEAGARKIIQALAKEGIKCTFEWLFFGKGPAPGVSGLKISYKSPSSDELIDQFLLERIQQGDGIALELELFHKLYHNTISLVVCDDCMSPRFKVGDHVAGRRYFLKDIEKTIGYDCIVETEEGEKLVRTVKYISKEGKFCLVCLNPKGSCNKTVETKVLYVAPVIWIRRKCPISGSY